LVKEAYDFRRYIDILVESNETKINLSLLISHYELKNIELAAKIVIRNAGREISTKII
jgi:hypothetical protein